MKETFRQTILLYRLLVDTFSDATLHVAQIIKYYEVSLSLNRPLGKYCPAMIFSNRFGLTKAVLQTPLSFVH